MTTIWKGFWSVKDVRAHPDKLWIFGDNVLGKGKRGQACIRDEPNAIGIPTKWVPSLRESAFFSDDKFLECTTAIDEAFTKIYKLLPDYEGIVLPENGLGTGLAQLDKRAPGVFRYLCDMLEELKKLKQI